MNSGAAAPFWGTAGKTYISYSNICANLVRNCLKKPFTSEAMSHENSKPMIGRRAGERAELIRLDDQKKQNEIRVWPKKKQRYYGYHDRSSSIIKKNLSKLLRVNRAFKHPKYTEVVKNTAIMIENDDSFKRTKLFKFFFPKKLRRYNDPRSNLLKRTLPAVRPLLNFSVMQYILNTKNKMNFDPVLALKKISR